MCLLMDNGSHTGTNRWAKVWFGRTLKCLEIAVSLVLKSRDCPFPLFSSSTNSSASTSPAESLKKRNVVCLNKNLSAILAHIKSCFCRKVRRKNQHSTTNNNSFFLFKHFLNNL